MTNRKERLRNILIKKEFLAGKRILDKFLSNKTSFNEYFKSKIAEYPDMRAVTDEYSNVHLSYSELESQISCFASALQKSGLKKGAFVGIFSEHNGRWICIEQAVMRCGAIATLRGSKAPVEELNYILNHCEPKGLILENSRLFEKIKPYIQDKNLKFVIVMFNNEKTELSGVDYPVYYYEDVCK